jgi:hypothetical protein
MLLFTIIMLFLLALITVTSRRCGLRDMNLIAGGLAAGLLTCFILALIVAIILKTNEWHSYPFEFFMDDPILVYWTSLLTSTTIMWIVILYKRTRFARISRSPW